jgi:hypothetical protein
MNERNMSELAAVSWDAKMLLSRLGTLDIMVTNDAMPKQLRDALTDVIESVARFTYRSEWALDSDLMVD